MRALIIGAGIAGPVLGVFLRRLGMEVRICEARSEPVTSEGAFLAVAPNGLNILREAGASAEVRSAATVCSGFDFLNARGQLIAQIDGREDEQRFGSPLVIVRRTDLHRALLNAAAEAGVSLRFGARLTAIDSEDPRCIRACFDDGSEEAADFVVGSDGIRSRTRALVLPDSPEPAFLEQLDFGGYGRADDAPIEVGRNVMVFGRRAFFGAFRREDGQIWWFHNGGNREPMRELAPEARRDRILASHADDPSWLGDVIRSTPQILGPWALHEIATMPRWYSGRVCLIGDAAHATSPSSGQGASLAMEDAMMLARCLRDERDPEKAFGAFVSLRRARVERIVKQSRRIGSTKVASSALSAWFRDRLLPFFLKLGASAQRDLYTYRIDWNEAASGG